MPACRPREASRSGRPEAGAPRLGGSGTRRRTGRRARLGPGSRWLDGGGEELGCSGSRWLGGSGRGHGRSSEEFGRSGAAAGPQRRAAGPQRRAVLARQRVTAGPPEAAARARTTGGTAPRAAPGGAPALGRAPAGIVRRFPGRPPPACQVGRPRRARSSRLRGGRLPGGRLERDPAAVVASSRLLAGADEGLDAGPGAGLAAGADRRVPGDGPGSAEARSPAMARAVRMNMDLSSLPPHSPRS